MDAAKMAHHVTHCPPRTGRDRRVEAGGRRRRAELLGVCSDRGDVFIRRHADTLEAAWITSHGRRPRRPWCRRRGTLRPVPGWRTASRADVETVEHSAAARVDGVELTRVTGQ